MITKEIIYYLSSIHLDNRRIAEYLHNHYTVKMEVDEIKTIRREFFPKADLAVGDKARLKNGAGWANGKKPDEQVYNSELTVLSIDDDIAQVSINPNLTVFIDDLIKL